MSEQRVRVLYIAGTGRSGSTLLARMLGQVPGLVSVGEVRHFLARGNLDGPADVRCGCGAFFSQCPFWTTVRDRLRERGHVVDGRAVARLTRSVDRIRYVAGVYSPWRPARFHQRYRAFMSLLTDFYRVVLEVGEGTIVVDESKDLSLLYLLAREPEVELSVLHLVRDSRGVAHSWTRRRRKPEYVAVEEYLPRYSPIYSALDWNLRNVATFVARIWADRYVRVRYEDLVAEPRRTMRQLLEALGWPAQLEFIREDAVLLPQDDHLAAGNPNRFERERMPLALDEAWRSEMRPFDRRLVALLTFPLRWTYGYHQLIRMRRNRRSD